MAYGPRLNSVKIPAGYPRAGRIGRIVGMTNATVSVFISKPVQAARRSNQQALTIELPRALAVVSAA